MILTVNKATYINRTTATDHIFSDVVINNEVHTGIIGKKTKSSNQALKE